MINSNTFDHVDRDTANSFIAFGGARPVVNHLSVADNFFSAGKYGVVGQGNTWGERLRSHAYEVEWLNNICTGGPAARNAIR